MPASFQPVRTAAIGAVIGVAITMVAMVVVVASAGAGHGDYGAAVALFPAQLLLTFFEGGRIGPLSLASQFDVLVPARSARHSKLETAAN